MRQLARLFGKINATEQQQHAKHMQGDKRVGRKLDQLSATLSKTTRKLDHMAGDFDCCESDGRTSQAA